VTPIFTVGHSTHALDRFVEMLHAHKIEHLIDVRTLPRSRRNPQFNRESLAISLTGAGVAYTHMPELGGLREPRADSINTAWQNAAFRGYADHMQTTEFVAALDQLIEAASPAALPSCAPKPCHGDATGRSFQMCLRHVESRSNTFLARPSASRIAIHLLCGSKAAA
jgi:hypothetical protein